MDDLPPDLWDALRALRRHATAVAVPAAAVDRLVGLRLAQRRPDAPALTEAGRAILVAGSPSLWRDVA